MNMWESTVGLKYEWPAVELGSRADRWLAYARRGRSLQRYAH
jgi:hypothetical protein